MTEQPLADAPLPPSTSTSSPIPQLPEAHQPQHPPPTQPSQTVPEPVPKTAPEATTEPVPKSPPPSKRRRKRGPATLSPTPCFTCTRLRVVCDRQRPYCGVCRAQGRGCEGYRIIPIWGGGVVRRGKLQDLTVPGPVMKAVEEGRRRAERMVERERKEREMREREMRERELRQREGSGNRDGAKAGIPSAYPQVVQQLSSRSAEPGGNNNGQGNGGRMVVDGPGAGQPSGGSNPPVNAPADTPPNATTNAPMNTPVNTPPNAPQNALQSVPSNIPSNAPSNTPQNVPSSAPPNAPPSAPNHAPPNGYAISSPQQFAPNQSAIAGPQYPPPAPRGSLVGKESARMRYLIRYFSEVITPVIVALDGPTNPYRTSILATAKSCQTLQHAIAALSMTCLRQRTSRGLSVGKTPASRTSSQAHCVLMGQGLLEFGQISPEEQMHEENFHRITAVRAVDALLADPTRHADDLMASLLVLSLLFTCDEGVGSFPINFSTSKRLLDLRAGRDMSKPDRSGWILRLFAWFDTMTASINDREAHYLDRTSGEEAFIFASLTGCDSSLFAILSHLPRLNMLSQMKPVDQSVPLNIPKSPPPPVAPLLSVPPLSQPITPSDSPVPTSTAQGIQHGTDPRTGFWREWRAIRQMLLTWQPHSREAFPNLPDIISISESFRYSALLYLERLAHPYAPASSPHIQTLVNASMQHINAVHATVSLHWPLFITGAECTDEAHRSAVRQRCEDVQKNTGLVNNLKHLEVLERIWMTQDPRSVSTGPKVAALDRAMMGGEAFRWRRVLDAEVPGVEYVVI